MRESKSKERMAVWGWGAHYNHAAKLLMGTRDVHFEFQAQKSKMQEYYQQRFLYDLKRNKPKWFLDTSDLTENPINESFCLYHFPNIHKFIAENYNKYRSYKYGTVYKLK